MSDLVEAGFPSRALDLIEELALNCSAATEAASLRTRAAHTAVDTAEQASDPAAKRDSVEAALDLDHDNHRAQELLRDLDDDSTRDPERLGTWWKAFYTTHIVALTDVAIAVAAYVVGLVVLARLSLLGNAPLMWKRLWRKRSAWQMIAHIAVASTVAAACVFLLNRVTASPDGWIDIVAAAALLTLFVAATYAAVAVLAAWWASRPTIIVEVRGSKTGENNDGVDRAATGRLIATIGDLGASPPKGLEYTTGSDADNLTDASIDGVPGESLFAVLVTVVRLLLAPAGWRVHVETATDGTWAVAVTRNGRDLKTVLLTRSDVPTADGDAKASYADLEAMVAAFVLHAVTPEHSAPSAVFDWRSVGLYYIATAHHNDDEPRKEKLLLEALRRDSGNLDALVALRWQCFRRSKQPDELMKYRDWLAYMASHELTGSDWELLRRRVQYTLMLVACNAQVQTGDNPELNCVPDNVWPQIEDFRAWVLTENSDARLEEIRRPMVRTSKMALQCLRGPKYPNARYGVKAFDVAEETLSPEELYQYACLKAYTTPHHLRTNEKELEKVVEFLQMAAVDPVAVSDQNTDPWLKQVRASKAYKAAFSAPSPTVTLGSAYGG